MAIYKYDDKKKEVVEVQSVPKDYPIGNYINMRTTWSKTTKVEFSNQTMDEAINEMNNKER